LNYFPRDWSFIPEPIQIGDVGPNKAACVIGQVERTDWQPYRRKPFFEAILADTSGSCRVLWFNGKYLVGQLEPGKILLVYGKTSVYKHQLQFTNPKFHILQPDQPRDAGILSGPVYPAGGDDVLADQADYQGQFDPLSRAGIIRRGISKRTGS
jgi:ATP-dependent DNA helicase RecG